MAVRYWDGSQWAVGKFRHWNGSNWADIRDLYEWNGSSWVSVLPSLDPLNHSSIQNYWFLQDTNIDDSGPANDGGHIYSSSYVDVVNGTNGGGGNALNTHTTLPSTTSDGLIDFGFTNPGDQYTISLWLYFNSMGIGGVFLTAHTGGRGVEVRGDQSTLSFGYRDESTSSQRVAQYQPSLNQWYHFVNTVSVGNYSRLYVNGVFDNQASGASGDSISDYSYWMHHTQARLGGSSSSSTPGDYIINAVSVFTSVISDWDILGLYYYGLWY